jgi:hypothetical protein
MRGEVIAVVVSSLESGQNLNFAVPINYANPLLVWAKEEEISSLPKQKVDTQSANSNAPDASASANAQEKQDKSPDFCILSPKPNKKLKRAPLHKMLKNGTLKCDSYVVQEILKNNTELLDKVYPGWILVFQSPNNSEEFRVLLPKGTPVAANSR